jgi:hypothetical protein
MARNNEWSIPWKHSPGLKKQHNNREETAELGEKRDMKRRRAFQERRGCL